MSLLASSARLWGGEMRWCEAIEDAFELRVAATDYRCMPDFCTPAAPEQLDIAQSELNGQIPVELRSLLLESNGIKEMMSIDRGDWFLVSWIVWPIDELIDENTRLRSAPAADYEPLDPSAWLFFSTAGVDGIYFAHPRRDDGSCGSEVFAWNSFERRVYGLAAGLEEFLVGWVRGTISV